MMTGNCLGWIAYGYYQGCDPFLLASNIPGLIISIWLNSGAAKLQYYELYTAQSTAAASHAQEERNHENNAEEQGQSESPAEDEWDASAPLVGDSTGTSAAIGNTSAVVTVPQERTLTQVLCFWAFVISFVTFAMNKEEAADTVGIVVNFNLVFFYAAPLQTMFEVMSSKNSASIHRPTMYMNWCSASFWVIYGIAKMDPVIMIPNSIGLCMGLTMGVLCMCYSASTQQIVDAIDSNPLLESLDNEDGEEGQTL
mmetsp:Transcript_8980/g.18637  ORF Transcript_8980/g.18637 Transcript_8980/m.18637 type:complete len:254 (-) Transcript_8980:1308-2069(-)